jgi:hypothetical protein
MFSEEEYEKDLQEIERKYQVALNTPASGLEEIARRTRQLDLICLQVRELKIRHGKDIY